MFDGPGLAISLPAGELAAVDLPGSVFSLQDLVAAPVSSDLRVAIDLVAAAAHDRGVSIVCVARPEIFTHSDSLAWLQQRLAGIAHHLCFSDGLAVRVIPQMKNHVFLYRPGIEANTQAFARLARRAPEFLASLASQVNSAFSVVWNGTRHTPPSIVLPGLPSSGGSDAQFYPFFLNRHSAQLSAAHSLGAGPLDPANLAVPARLVYVPLTETAARDRCFAEKISTDITAAYFDSALCVVLRLPWVASARADLADRMATALAGLCVARANIPRVTATNVVFCTEDLNPLALVGGDTVFDILAHETFDFWRHSHAFYQCARDITVYAPARRRADRGLMRSVFRQVLGRDLRLAWLPYHDETAG